MRSNYIIGISKIRLFKYTLACFIKNKIVSNEISYALLVRKGVFRGRLRWTCIVNKALCNKVLHLVCGLCDLFKISLFCYYFNCIYSCVLLYSCKQILSVGFNVIKMYYFRERNALITICLSRMFEVLIYKMLKSVSESKLLRMNFSVTLYECSGVNSVFKIYTNLERRFAFCYLLNI